LSIEVTLESNGVVNISPEEKPKQRDGKTDHHVTWLPGSTGESFTFHDLKFDASDAPFSDIDVKDKKITAKDKIRKDSGTQSWSYTVWVKDSQGHVHSSSSPDFSDTGGRGVIRNEG